MSGDLISRKALIDEISYAYGLGDSIIQNVIGTIERHPKSYDMDKVLKILQDRIDFYEKRFSQMRGNDRDVEDWGSIKSYKDAIEIVKSGGIE